MKPADGAIGVFDSGVGGLSVLRHLRDILPHEDLLYVADQAHVPYGSRSVGEIRLYAQGITRFLLERGAKIIVVACNTASAAALSTLRDTFPQIPIVGMEPAVKPAAAVTRSGVVGVLATPATFASPRYGSLMSRFAADVAVLEDPCAGLVPLIEAGLIEAPETAHLLAGILQPMLRAGADTFVLGCTHYPFVQPLIEAILADQDDGRTYTIIDPAPAVARQTGRVLRNYGRQTASPAPGSLTLYTTAANGTLDRLAALALGEAVSVHTLAWHGNELETAEKASL